MYTNELESNPLYLQAKEFVFDIIAGSNYPVDHPFLEYPQTPEGMSVLNIIFLKMLDIGDKNIIDMIEKCRSVEHNEFNYQKYRQNINEVLFLYYLLIHIIYKNYDMPKISYQEKNIIRNRKIPEYSLLFEINEEKILMNIEVKTLSCDAFPYGKIVDGQQLIMPYHKDKVFIERLVEEYPNAIVLSDKCCLNQMEGNIRKIATKFKGENMTPYKLFNVGVIFIDNSSSIEQFHSYLFNENFGLLNKIDFGNIDALIIFTMDAKVDLLFSNIYNMEYVQTYLKNDCEIFKKICRLLRLDNYMGIGKSIHANILKNSKKEFEIMKIMKREGFINIIPYDATEDQIDEYVSFLKGDKPRNYVIS